MTKKGFLFFLGLIISVGAYSQEVKNYIAKDSLHKDLPQKAPLQLPSEGGEGIDASLIDFKSLGSAAADAATLKPKGESVVSAPTMNSGMVGGYNGRVMNFSSIVNVAGIKAYQKWDNLSLSGDLYLSKGLYNGIGVVNGVGFNFGVDYSLTNNVSIHAIGGITSFGYLGPQPNATGAYYGGFVSLLTNNHKWGLDVGARRVYNNFSGRWETIPIAMPYYNLNGAKIGIDVGGLLYGILDGAAEKAFNKSSMKSDAMRGPAIIAPPIDVTPHFAPIETPKWVEEQYNRK